MEVYLKAYYRMNLGDDMFVKCIAERYPEACMPIVVILRRTQYKSISMLICQDRQSVGNYRIAPVC